MPIPSEPGGFRQLLAHLPEHMSVRQSPGVVKRILQHSALFNRYVNDGVWDPVMKLTGNWLNFNGKEPLKDLGRKMAEDGVALGSFIGGGSGVLAFETRYNPNLVHTINPLVYDSLADRSLSEAGKNLRETATESQKAAQGAASPHVSDHFIPSWFQEGRNPTLEECCPVMLAPCYDRKFDAPGLLTKEDAVRVQTKLKAWQPEMSKKEESENLLIVADALEACGMLGHLTDASAKSLCLLQNPETGEWLRFRNEDSPLYGKAMPFLIDRACMPRDKALVDEAFAAAGGSVEHRLEVENDHASEGEQVSTHITKMSLADLSDYNQQFDLLRKEYQRMSQQEERAAEKVRSNPGLKFPGHPDEISPVKTQTALHSTRSEYGKPRPGGGIGR